MRKRAMFLVLVLAAVGAIVWWSYALYNKPHRSVKDEKAISVSAVQLFRDFEASESMANQKYLGQVLEVTGKVSDIIVNQDGKVVLMLETENPLYVVACTLTDKSTMVEGDDVVVKGICSGYLSDVIISRAIVVSVM